jgi:galactokinase
LHPVIILAERDGCRAEELVRVSCWAPGRVNLMGEHTDYSGGLVLPIAIQLGITITYEPAEEMALRAPGGERFAGAVERELAELGRPNVGIAAVVESDLPQGAGLGSSGAFEVAVALALCGAAEFELEPLELALACRRAERRAVGVPSGILDQAASLLGREGHALLLDCGSLDYRWVPLPDDVAILVLDSGERHSLEESGYADRRRELEAGDPRRVRHLETENRRVRETVAALERGDVSALGPLFAESHASLRHDYEVSTPTLDALVAAALEAGAFAARMTGGGFGGSIVALAEPARAEAVLRGTGVQGWIVQASDGALRRRTGSTPDSG